MINKNILKWLKDQRKKQLLNVQKINLSNLSKWIYNNKEICHKSKNFKIAGLEFNQIFIIKRVGINQ